MEYKNRMCGNFGSLRIHNMFFKIYLSNGTNVYGSMEFEGPGSEWGVESCEITFLGGTSYSLAHILTLYNVSFSHNAQHHRQTDRQKTLSCQ